jgi:hypothetical protein
MGSNARTAHPGGSGLRYPASCTPFSGWSLDEQFASTWRGWNLPWGRCHLCLRESPDELERKRRDLLVQQGRIIDATVIDISDLTAEESGRPNGMQLILYKYEAAGVVYECSQDVTMLRHLVNIYDCRLGFPASVRYDPHNPGNSLIVAESWSGLRDTANSVPLHGRTGAAAPSMR